MSAQTSTLATPSQASDSSSTKSTTMDLSDIKREMVTVCHDLAKLRYTTGTGGNLAVRIDRDTMLITPTRMPKNRVTESDLVLIDFSGKVLQGKHKPSGEWPMYANFFKLRPDVNTALHCHPQYVNAFAVSSGINWLARPMFPETIIEVGPAVLVPYDQPLTQSLADQFIPFLNTYNAFIMQNHGLVLLNALDLAWVWGNLELLEMTAKHICHALAMGPVRELSRNDLLGLEKVMLERELVLPGAPGVNRSLLNLYPELS